MPKKISNKTFSSVQKDALLKILENRFLKNMHRHKEIEWEKVKAKLNRTCAKRLYRLQNLPL